MHAFLASNLDLPVTPDTLHIHPENSIGIDEIRRIQAFLFRKPTQSEKNIVVVHQAEKLTLPAQQAFLKTLEEPPGKSEIYLLTLHPDQLLPTVLSRVQIKDTPSNPVIDLQSSIIAKLLEVGIGERLLLLDSQEFTRETLLQFLDQLEMYIHNNLNSVHHLYSTVHQSRLYLKSNCSLRLVLNHLTLNLTSQKSS